MLDEANHARYTPDGQVDEAAPRSLRERVAGMLFT